MQYTEITGGITAPKGFLAAGVKAGIKQSGNPDVALIYSTVRAAAAAVFTTNAFQAAPVGVSRRAIEDGYAQAIVVNSGNANACTGEQGTRDAEKMVQLVAEHLKVQNQDVIVSSTGIIGVQLPMDKVELGIATAVTELSEQGGDDAMQAILTTDLVPKQIAIEFLLGGTIVKMAGMAKGSGMIEPNMATMLGFITTDVAIAPGLLKKALTTAVDKSFNMITVDGDTSTNDMAAILANGQAQNPLIDGEGSDYEQFCTALDTICVYLAKCIARDGEGATKFLEIQVKGAVDRQDAVKAAKAIANSSLVKTAFFGQDPNWGRILAAVGYSGAKVNTALARLDIGGVDIVQNGMPIECNKAALHNIMAEHDIVVRVDLGCGSQEAVVWTCDFSYEYVKINGEYHT